MFRSENHSTSHVFVQISCYDLGADKEEDMWKTVFFPKLICDDSDIEFMFRRMFENNVLHLCVRSNCRYVECSREI